MAIFTSYARLSRVRGISSQMMSLGGSRRGGGGRGVPPATAYTVAQLVALQVGGTPAVLKYLLSKGLIDGSCLTVTGEASGSQSNMFGQAVVA